MAVVGIDACARGWVGVVLQPGAGVGSSQDAVAVAAPRFGDLVELVPGATVVAVDMPVGLSGTGLRRADVAARAALGRRRATIFLTPVL